MPKTHMATAAFSIIMPPKLIGLVRLLVPHSCFQPHTGQASRADTSWHRQRSSVGNKPPRLPGRHEARKCYSASHHLHCRRLSAVLMSPCPDVSLSTSRLARRVPRAPFSSARERARDWAILRRRACAHRATTGACTTICEKERMHERAAHRQRRSVPPVF